MSKAKTNPSGKPATNAAIDGKQRTLRSDVVAQTLLRRIDRLIAQTAVCAAAAWDISEDDGKRPREAAASMPLVLDGIREELEKLHGDIEFLVPEERP
jgi:hypothetical protein